jgi:hypothetical protein
MADQHPSAASLPAAAAAASTLSLPQRDQCLTLIAALKESAKHLMTLTDAAEIKQRVSRMMLDMLSLNRLNREVFDAIAAEGSQLQALRVRVARHCCCSVGCSVDDFVWPCCCAAQSHRPPPADNARRSRRRSLCPTRCVSVAVAAAVAVAAVAAATTTTTTTTTTTAKKPRDDRSLSRSCPTWSCRTPTTSART